MANKVQEYLELSDLATKKITSSYREWMGFLSTVGRLYKYPYSDQLLIHAQRPDATACADYDLWNKQMRRYVMQGAKGIALIDTSTGKDRVRYVFDVSDTGEKENARRPWLWQYRPEHQQAVASALENRYGISGENGLADQLENIAAQLASEYWNDNRDDLLRIVDGSFLEEYDDLNIEIAFKRAATVSITYAMMSRCGLEPESYFEHEDFLSFFDFNTKATATALGLAVSQSTEQVLRQIEVTIRNYEREKFAERSMEHGERDQDRAGIQTGGGRSAPGAKTAGEAEPEPDQVRATAPEVSEGESPGAVGNNDDGRDTVQPSAGSGGPSQRDAGSDDAVAGERGGSHGTVESQGPHEVGGADELLQSTSGGNHSGRTDLQLNNEPVPEGPSVETPGPFVVSQEESEPPTPSPAPEPPAPTPTLTREVTQADIDDALQEWNGDIASKRRVQQYMADHGREKGTADWLRNEYGDDLPAFPVTADGAGTDLPWSKVQRHLARLVKEDRFFTEQELDNFEDVDTAYVREQLEQDQPSPFVEQVTADVEQIAAAQEARTVREIYEQYKPIVTNLVLADVAYQNACRNSDKENALIEGNAAVTRAVLTITEPLLPAWK